MPGGVPRYTDKFFFWETTCHMGLGTATIGKYVGAYRDYRHSKAQQMKVVLRR